MFVNNKRPLSGRKEGGFRRERSSLEGGFKREPWFPLNNIDKYCKPILLLFITTMDSSSSHQNTRINQMKQIQSQALELFTRKNTDYGDAFAEFGVIGVLMRIEDKIKRALSITKNGINLVNDESIRDTMLDLHNYAAMALMLLDEK